MGFQAQRTCSFILQCCCLCSSLRNRLCTNIPHCTNKSPLSYYINVQARAKRAKTSSKPPGTHYTKIARATKCTEHSFKLCELLQLMTPKAGKTLLSLLTPGTSSSKSAGSGHVLPLNCKRTAGSVYTNQCIPHSLNLA